MSQQSERKPLFGNALTKLAADAARAAAPVFAAKDWRYGGRKGRLGFVPDEAYLAASIAQLLESAAPDNVGSTSSGRFTVSRWYEEGDPEEWVQIDLCLADDSAHGKAASS